MRKLNPRIILPLFVLLFLSIPLFSQSADFQIAWVKRVVDGHTLLLFGAERVRLIGVDTPEVHEFKKLHRDAERSGKDTEAIRALGRMVSAFTKKMLDRKLIRREFDPNNYLTGHGDKYGRILAYVYLMDGTFLNAEILIKEGYGFAYNRFPFKYMEEFRSYEKMARVNKRGLWGE